MSQKAFVLDLDRCTGCAACVIACTNENRPSPGAAWRRVVTFNRPRWPGQPVAHYSLACNHCLDPPCLFGCPAGAYRKDPESGAVRLDQDLCMGCRYCTWVCPYDAPRFESSTGVVEKCTFCDHRLDEGLDPACVVACPVDALGLETLEEPPAIRRSGFPEVGIRPAIRIAGDRRAEPPELTAAPAAHLPRRRRRFLHWTGLGAEWSLWVFTLAVTLLVAWFTAATATGGRVSVVAFTTIGAIALAASALHLGRPTRAWRGILNWRRSWISREALLVVFFLGAGSAVAALDPAPPLAAQVVAVAGFAALFAMDMVYRVPGQTSPAVPHSAMATLTAAFLLGLFLLEPALAIPAAGTKLILYLQPRARFKPGGTPLLIIRVVVGLALPGFLIFADGIPPWLLIGMAAAGELIDRAEFYAGLEFLTPEIQVHRDLLRSE